MAEEERIDIGFTKLEVAGLLAAVRATADAAPGTLHEHHPLITAEKSLTVALTWFASPDPIGRDVRGYEK